MRPRAAGIVVALATLGLACHNATGPQGPLAGHWYGFSTDYGLDLVLTDGSDNVRGSGTIGGNAVSNIAVPVAVTGSNSSSTFTMTLKAEHYNPATYAGTVVDDTTLTGTINGSGFVAATLTVYRQH
jgi:hypothetical protein